MTGQSGQFPLVHLEVLVGLCNRQHFVAMVDPLEFTEWAQQPLAAVAVPLHPLLLVLRAGQDLKQKNQEAPVALKERLLRRGRQTNLWPEAVGGRNVFVLSPRSPPGVVKFETLVAEV